MANPNEILDQLGEDEEKMTNINERLATLKEMMAKNGYTGKYRPIFGDLYEEILGAKDVMVHVFEDGFQFSDLEEVFVAAMPVLKEVWNEAIPKLKDPNEAEAFLKDLIIFVYYEIEPLIKSWGWIKFFLRIALRVYVAGKIASYMKYAFNKADGAVGDLMNHKFVAKAQKFVDAVM